MPSPTIVSGEFVKYAMSLFKANYNWDKPIRSIGLSVTDFDYNYALQFDLAGTAQKREKLEQLETAVDRLKDRYGNYCIQKACALCDKELSHFSPCEKHIIHPVCI